MGAPHMQQFSASSRRPLTQLALQCNMPAKGVSGADMQLMLPNGGASPSWLALHQVGSEQHRAYRMGNRTKQL